MTAWIQTLVDALWDARTDREVYRATTEAASELLDADGCLLAIESDGELRPRACSAGQLPGEGQTISSLSLPGMVYREGEPRLVADRTDTRSSGQAATLATGDVGYRSLLAVPFGDRGVLIVGAHEPNTFDEADRQRAMQICEFASAVLDQDRSGQHRENQLEEVADSLAHDLRTPLQVARGRVALSRADDEESHLEDVEAALDRIETLVEDFSLLARGDSWVDETTVVSLRDVAERAWETVGTNEATLTVEASEPIRADESTLCQLLENLLKNAIEHGGSAVSIRLGVHDDGFYVADDGPGIDADQRDAVFDWGVSFAGGTGFGLGIVDRIAAEHGWDASVTESEAGGARFEFSGVEFEA